MAKVTDPDLLAQLDGGAKVTDPSVLAQLEPQAPPGVGSRFLSFLTTPFPGMQPTIDKNKAQAEPAAFPVTNDSSDARVALQSVLSGVPGYQARDTTDEEGQREARFRKEHGTAAFLLPILGGLGKPAALPATVASDAAQEAGPVTRALLSGARKAGRRTLYGGANGLSERFPVADASIDKAAGAGAFKVGGTTEHAADTLSDALEQAGNVKGDVMQQIEKAGLQGPDSANLAHLLRSKAALLRKNTVGTGIPDLYEKIADEVEAAGNGGRLGAQQAENIKQSLQDAAKYGMPTERLLNRARKNIASTMRQANEDSIGADAVSAGTPEAQAASDALVPAKQDYALLAPAAAAAEKGLSQATKRNAFSLRDTTLAAGHGAGGTLTTLLLSKAARTFGPSTLASGLYKGAALSPKAAQLAEALTLRGIPQDVAADLAGQITQQQ